VDTKNVSAKLTSGRRLTKNTLWNLLGGVLPLLAGMFAIPLLIKGLGADSFGVLGIAWMVVGYFSLFDLGLGRALTILVAKKLGSGKSWEIPPLVGTALLLMALLGVVGAVALICLSPWLVHRALKIPVALQAETLKAFYLLALSIPFIISTTAFRGILMAYQRFDLTNIVRIPLGLFNFLGPLAVLPFSNSLSLIVAVLVAGRVAAWGVHFWLCSRFVPAFRQGMKWRQAMLRPLLSFGGWVSVSNVVGPLMAYLDRFLIGALISMAAVAYYITPYEVVVRLWLIPSALIGVLFPVFSSMLVQDRDRAAQLFGRAINYIFLVVFPLILIIVTFAQEGLGLWVGTDLAQHSTLVLQWLAVGVFVNSMAMVPFALVQAAGRPDITAKLHLLELPLYLLGVWWLTINYGIYGTAIAWVGRVALDTIALFFVVQRFLPATVSAIRRMTLFFAGALLSLVLGASIEGLVGKGLFLGTVMLIFVLSTWFFLLIPEERIVLKRFWEIRFRGRDVGRGVQ